jgi:hypothetical protein
VHEPINQRDHLSAELVRTEVAHQPLGHVRTSRVVSAPTYAIAIQRSIEPVTTLLPCRWNGLSYIERRSSRNQGILVERTEAALMAEFELVFTDSNLDGLDEEEDVDEQTSKGDKVDKAKGANK